jgi:antitoxin (DNA-binding transcriptional repressor) of toxin-antitoxin stability system
MKMRRAALALLVAAALSGGAHTVAADEAAALTGEIQTMDASATTKGAGAVTGKIATDFQSLAGSRENSTALVSGLRNGSEVTLTQKGEPSATFTPATKPMGYGNVSTSLSLAKYQLAQQGITNPTPEQLKIALNGGTIDYGGKTVDYQGVLQMRADGMGWGQIGQRLGTKLGPVVSGMKAQNTHIATLPAVKQHAATSTSASATNATNATRATGANAASNGRSASGGKGIVTASGAEAAPSTVKGKGADGVTSAGNGASSPRGQGIVTAAGTGASPVAQGNGNGKGGVVTASGVSTGASAAGGSSNGNGKAVGHTK